ncbi:MAG: TonB-dependent receptor [Pseudomonadota bacterium]
MTSLQRIFGATGIFLFLPYVGEVLAQPQAADTPFTAGADPVIEEVIVSGTKQDLTLQEIDVSVEVFSQERMNKEALFDLSDVLRRIPNVVSEGSNAQISIRGISRSGLGGQGVTSNIYLDGAPLNSRALSLGSDSVWDIAQIEVLRGPQSTVQGRNALAGAIVMRTADPTYEWQAKGRLRGAEYGGRQYAAALSGPIVEDQLAFRLAADLQQSDGFIRNALTGAAQDDLENLLLRAKLLFEPAALENLRAVLTIDYNNTDSGTNAVTPPVPASDPDFTDFDTQDFLTFQRPVEFEAETLRVLSDVSYELTAGLTARFIGTWETTEGDEALGDTEDPGRFPLGSESDNFSNDTRSAELRLEYRAGRWSGYVGAYYFEDENDRDLLFQQPLSSAAPLPWNPADSVFGLVNVFQSETQNYAFYGQARFEMNERWTFDVSLRYDREEFFSPGVFTRERFVNPADCFVTIPGALVGSTSPTIDAPCLDLLIAATPNTDEPPQSTTFDAWLPRFTATYSVDEDLSIFVSAQRGYRAGGAFLRQIPADLDGNLGGAIVGAYDPEYLDNFEVGFRSQWLDRRLTVNGNIFYSLWDDQQIQIQGPSGAANDQIIVNAGQSDLYGAEIGSSLIFGSGFDVYASLAFLETRIEDFPFAQSGPFQNLRGSELPSSPGVSFTVGGSYRHASGFFANASLNYTGERESAGNVENLDETLLGPGLTELLEPRSVLNARIGYEGQGFIVFAYGTNLLDETDSINSNIAGVSPSSGELFFTPIPRFSLPQPRTLGVGVDFQI